MSDKSMTTAAALNSFRKELLEGGFTGDEASYLAGVALDKMLDAQGEPLIVRSADGDAA